jgi:quercetin dioxygenase-like cupin family protein
LTQTYDLNENFRKDPPTKKRSDKLRKKRTFVRQIDSSTYSLTGYRRELIGSVPRVWRPDLREDRKDAGGDQTIMDPGDETFRSQSLHVHFTSIAPGGWNEAHGHQNEAFFYILEGRGFEMHDGLRYDWEEGDGVSVHNDAVHWHNNLDPDNRAVALVFKAKPTYLFMGLWQQGLIGTRPPDDHLYEPPIDWLVARSPEDVAKKKVLKPTDTPWEWTPHGHIRWIAADHVPFRIHATDCYLHEIPAGSRSGKRWQMADQVIYVQEGEGYSLMWDVDVSITDQYYAHIALEPSRWEWKKGDMIWVPHNSVFQHFNTSPDKPVKLIVASNRMFNKLGYSNKVDMETAPEWEAQQAKQPAAV